MPDDDTRPAWLAADWQAEAERWVRAHAPAAGPAEAVRIRPWSVGFRTPTPDGPVWFKANPPSAAYEPALVRALATWTPDAVLRPIAVDSDRGWLLTPDGGPILRDVTEDRARFTQALAEYAVLQRRLESRSGEMIALGVPDARPARVPEQLDELLDGPFVDADLAAKVRPLRPALVEWCAELAEDGVSATLQHDDLHDGNVFADGDRIFDWGDASVAHPFVSLLVAVEMGPEDADRAALRDAYLAPWTADHDRDHLHRSAALAARIGRVSRAAAWQRALRDADLPRTDRWWSAVSGWLETVLAD